MSKVVVPFLRSAYNYDRDSVSTETGLKCEDESLTKQSFAEECDINTIVRRFGVDGILPQNVRMPTYDDFTMVTDFKSAMDAVAKARESFDAMPAAVRAKFQNDPAAFVDFCSDDKNLDEAVKLGLVREKDAADLEAERVREAERLERVQASTRTDVKPSEPPKAA